ncbi:MAG: insulinase family protein [Oscillospiraceae bacterium]|nr:insulinase family protein [Oscillospiraceae bacterium]
MERMRRELLPGVYLTGLRTDKFKTGLISVSFLTRLCREEASMNALIPRVLRRGSVHYPDMDALSARLDELYGARLEPLVRKRGEIQCVGFWADFVDGAYLPGEAGADQLEQVGELLGEIILAPNTRGGLLRPEYVESEKEKLLEDIRARINDKIAYSRFRLTELMCQTEAYGVDVLGTEERVENIRYDALTRRYKALLATSPVEIFYCGREELDRVAEVMTRAMDTLPRGQIDYDIGTDIRMNALEEQTRVYTEAMDVGQGKLAIGYRMGSCMEEPDIAAIQVMNAVFGGSVSSKLFMNVREKLSLCYFASSGIDIYKGLMYVISGIEPENYEIALGEIGRQLRAVQAGDITDEELETAKASLASDLRGLTDSAGQLEGFWLGQSLLGLDYGPEEQAALVEMVTREDVVRAAAGIECDTVYFLRDKEGGHE